MGLDEKPLAFRAWYAMLAAETRLEDRVSGDLEQQAGLPLSWFEVLAHLHWHPDGRERMSELADELLLSRGGATRLVARLEDAGLLIRETPKSDRRATYAVATAEGREKFEAAFPVLLESVTRNLAEVLDEEDLEDLVRIMTKLLGSLDPDCGAIFTVGAEAGATPPPPPPS